MKWHGSSVKAARRGRYPQTRRGHTTRGRLMTVHGRRWQTADGLFNGAVSGTPLTVSSYTRFTDVKVSRRPKRATSVAVIRVLLTNSRLGIRGGYSHGHRLSLHARPRISRPSTLVSNGTSVAILFNIIYQDALAAVAKGSQFWLLSTIMFSRIYKSHCADSVLPCFHTSFHEHPCGLCQPWRLPTGRI